jgi:hypothetical protein
LFGNWTVILYRSAGNQEITRATFRVIDPFIPAVFDLRPIAGTNYNTSETIEIAANVTDDYLVDTVLANVSYPNSTSIILTLNNTVGDKYNTSFTIPSNLTGQYDILFIANDTFNNVNDTETTYFIALTPKAIAIALSNTLAGGVFWNISTLPTIDANATGNNNTGPTEYYVRVFTNGTNADVYMRANANLTSGLNTINLSNERFSLNLTDSTVPFNTKYSITTNFTNNKIGFSLVDNSTIFLKFFLNVSGGQAAGTYNNTVEFKAVQTGFPP